jgi:hypothetical protein
VSAELKLFVQRGLHVLHVVVKHWDDDDCRQRGNSRDGDSEESEPFEGLGLAETLLDVVTFHFWNWSK